jgi:ADP-heptose:LPS heptosyltransferase
MKLNRLNYDYLNLLKEPAILFKLELAHKKKIGLHPSPKKILIINSCLVGEFAVSVHSIKKIIDKYKQNVDILVSPSVKPLAKRIRGIDNVYTAKSIYDRNTEKEKANFDIKGYDQIIVLRISPDAYEVLKKLNFSNLKSYFRTYFKFIKDYVRNMFKKNELKQWRDINFEIIGEKPVYYHFEEIFDFTKEDYEKIKKLPELQGKEKKVIIHTNGAGWQVKKWDEKKWVELIKKINYIQKFKFIFVGTNEEKETYKKILEKSDVPLYSLIGKLDLEQLALVMKLSDYFIGVDSGPMNIAHLAGIRSVSLFGPGQRTFLSKNPNDIAIDKSDCMCTTLFCHKRNTCFNKITVEDVFNGFKKIIGK